MDVSIDFNDREAVLRRAIGIRDGIRDAIDSRDGRCCVTYKNPKSGDTVQSSLSKDEAVWLLRCNAHGKPSDFVNDLARKYNRFGKDRVNGALEMKGLSVAQLYWVYKLAEEEMSCLMAPAEPVAGALNPEPGCGHFGDLADKLIWLKEGGQGKPKMRATRADIGDDEATAADKTLVFALAYSERDNKPVIFVRSGHKYPAAKLIGRISLVGEKWLLADIKDATVEQMLAAKGVAEDFEGELGNFGLLTGNCSICGRKLTDPVSVAEGIGPTCAKRLGVKWGAEPKTPWLGPPKIDPNGWFPAESQCVPPKATVTNLIKIDKQYIRDGMDRFSKAAMIEEDADQAAIDAEVAGVNWSPDKEPPEPSTADRVRDWVDGMAVVGTREQLLKKATDLGLID